MACDYTLLHARNLGQDEARAVFTVKGHLALEKWPIYLLVSLSQKHTNNPPGFTLHIMVGMIHYTTDFLMPLYQEDVWKMHSFCHL
jgi:hypothetical protein